MGNKLQKLVLNDWTWHLKYPEVLIPWFGNYHSQMQKTQVKSNALRTVFRVKSSVGCCYVKYDQPRKGFATLKNKFRPKVKMEYESALLLEENGIPVVEYLGWGQNGAKGMLISRELRNSCNARDFWFGTVIHNPVLKKQFLENMAVFLSRFLRQGLYHPDLHLGNLLVEPEICRFVIVDPYGIERMGNPKLSLLFNMWRIIGALRGEISNNEVIRLIIRSGITPDARDAITIWYDILDEEAFLIDKLWNKRKKQILTGNVKYVRKIIKNDQTWTIRISMGNRMMVEEKDLANLENKLVRYEMTGEQARKEWLCSFKLQFHRIDHTMPVVWCQNKNSPDFLFFEKTTETDNPTSVQIEEFSKRCKIARVDIKDIGSYIKLNARGYPFLSIKEDAEKFPFSSCLKT